MSRMFLAPSRYVQGAGAIAEMGIHAARMGTKALFTRRKDGAQRVRFHG